VPETVLPSKGAATLYALLGTVVFIAVVAASFVWNVIQGFGLPALVGAVVGALAALPCKCQAGYISLSLSSRTTACTTTAFPFVHLREAFDLGSGFIEHAEVVLEGAIIGAIGAAVLSAIIMLIVGGLRESGRGKSPT
jgi:hypothetical protein